MTIHYRSPHSIQEAGFKLINQLGPQDHWLIVGQWHSSFPREAAIGLVQHRMLVESFGRRRVGELHQVLETGMVHLVVVDDGDDIMAYVEELGLDWESGGVLNEELYSEFMSQLAQAQWAALPIVHRLDMAVTHATAELAFREECPHRLLGPMILNMETW